MKLSIVDSIFLSDEQHELFLPTVYGLRSNKGMPPFGGILEPEQVEKVRQYIIKRSHDLRNEMTGRVAEGESLEKEVPIGS